MNRRAIRAAGLGLALLLPLIGLAQFRHPRYLSARSDLRRAAILMRIPEEPNAMRDMRVASDSAERAIHELDLAARFDRRDIDDNPRVDTRMGRGSRFREILRLLDAARNDISQEEDNPAAREWRNRAFRAIDDAAALVRRGGYDKFRDESAGYPAPINDRPPAALHPRYASAIADLRYARALLWREDWRDAMRDQHGAVDEIDRAIGEARRAAIDDGKKPDDHPPIEARLGWEGRFRKALELLDSAERDLSMAEDNPNAAAWRGAARQNIENAKSFVGRAMRASWWR
jgi:hypothetical protein